jgi:hypothetical protein
MARSDTSQSVRWGNITWSWCGERRERSVDHWSNHTSSLGGDKASRRHGPNDPLGRGSVEGVRNRLGRRMILRFVGL